MFIAINLLESLTKNVYATKMNKFGDRDCIAVRISNKKMNVCLLELHGYSMLWWNIHFRLTVI